MPWYLKTGYAPQLPSGLDLLGSEPRGKVAINVSGMKRPKFDELVRTALELRTYRKASYSLNGYPVLMYRCGACYQLGEGHLMHIGHITNWKVYVADKGPLSQGAAVAAYSDLANLRFEHAICNTSHQFENEDMKDEDQEADDEQDSDVETSEDDDTRREEMFDGLISKYNEPTDVPDEEIDMDNGTIRLPQQRPKHQKKTKTALFDFDEEDRPQFYDQTRDSLISEWHGKKLVSDGVNPEGKKITVYKCVSCRQLCEGFSMQLGHKDKWKQHAQSLGAKTKEQVFQAFNDLNNLAFECSSCNQGHEWEEYDENAPEFNQSGEDMREMQSDISDGLKQEAEYFKQQTMGKERNLTEDQAGVMTLLIELRLLETSAVLDGDYSQSVGRLKGIPVNMLSTGALQKRIEALYSGNPMAKPVSEQLANAYKKKYIEPMINGWNSEYGSHSPLQSDELDGFRDALFQNNPGDVQLFGRKVSGNDIKGCRQLYQAAAEQATKFTGKYDSYSQRLGDKPVQLSNQPGLMTNQPTQLNRSNATLSWSNGVPKVSSNLFY